VGDGNNNGLSGVWDRNVATLDNNMATKSNNLGFGDLSNY